MRMTRRPLVLFLVAGCGSRVSPENRPDATPVDTVDGSAQTCGGEVCGPDQTCASSGCIFSCSGATVPGDYASIQAAIDALAAAGQDAAICLAAGTYNDSEYIELRDPGMHDKSLSIIGPSMDLAKIAAEVVVRPGWGTVMLE